MKSSFANALLIGVTASSLWALPAAAERRADRDVNNAPSANQLVDMADARIASLKADLRLTPDQEKNWNGFQSAVHDIAAQRINDWNNARSGRSVASDNTRDNASTANTAPSTAATNNPDTSPQTQTASDETTNRSQAGSAPDAIQSLRDYADGLDRQAADLKKVADAAEPLYASLDNSQRSRLMNFIRSNATANQPAFLDQNRRRR